MAPRYLTKNYCEDCHAPCDYRALRCFNCAHPPTWGLKVRKSDGRMYVRCRDGSVTTYARVLMEGHLGRQLEHEEHAHHINGDCTDDRVENLEVLSKSDHHKLHSYPIYVGGTCTGCGCEYYEQADDCDSCFNRQKARRRRAALAS